MVGMGDDGYPRDASGALAVNWRDHIESDGSVLTGKPVVRGTRIAVDFVLGLLAEGWSESEVLKNYPRISPDALRAIFAYAAEALGEESVQAIARRPRP